MTIEIIEKEDSKICFVGFITDKSKNIVESMLDIVENYTKKSISRIFISKILIDKIEKNNDYLANYIKKINEKKYDYLIISSKIILKAITPSLLKHNNFISYIGGLPQYSDEMKNTKIIVVNDGSNYNVKSEEDQEDWVSLIVSALNTHKLSYEIDINLIKNDEDFEDKLNYIISLDNQYIGYDLETNAGNVFTRDSYCTIIGLSTTLPNTDKIKAFYYITNRGKISERLKNLLINFFNKVYKRVWTYNASMEIKWTNFLLGKFYEFQDARILVNMHGIRGSLKSVSKKELQVPSWETTVHEFIDDITILFKHVEYLKNRNKDAIELIKNADMITLEREYDSISRVRLILECYNKLCLTWSKEQIDDALSYFPYAWSSVPKDILGIYCAYDTVYTILLVKKFNIREVRKAYNIYIRHPWLASKFEINGVPWDDEKAKEVLNQSYEKMLNLLFELIKVLDIPEKDKIEAKTIYYSKLPYDIVTYTEKKKQERRTKVSTIYDKLEHLKTVLNLSSNTAISRNKFWDSFLNDEIKIAGMLLLFIENIELNKVANEKLKNKLGENFDYYSGNFKDIFTKIINIQEKTKDKSLSMAISNSISYAYENIENNIYRYEEKTIKFQYNVQSLFFGVDINNEETWNKKFKMLFNLFYYKKLDKMIGYINKNLGRMNVWYSLLGKDDIPLRISNYFDEKPKKYDLMVLNTDFNVLGADTTRWKSGWHTSPPSSPSRRCLVTRNKNQIWVHSDYSQAELVILSVMSHDKEMINSFVEGKDLHQFTASKVYKIPYDEVKTLQRKKSKAVNFGIVYGKSLESLAIDVTHGNIEEAQKLLDTFFNTFPNIKKFINKKRDEVDNLGKVSTLFGNWIIIDTNGRGNEKYRQAVNYPIQGSASTLAGTAMYNFIDYSEKKGFKIYPVGFTHDAIDFICEVDDLIKIIKIMVYKLQTEVREKTSIPMKIDYEISVDSFNLCNFSIKDNIINLKGSEEGILKILERLEKANSFKILSKKELSRKLIKSSWEDMFTNGTALNDNWGKEIINLEYELKVEIYND